MKPPIHGLALLWLMDHGVIDEADPPLEDRKWLLDRLIAWTEFFCTFRRGGVGQADAGGEVQRHHAGGVRRVGEGGIRREGGPERGAVAGLDRGEDGVGSVGGGEGGRQDQGGDEKGGGTLHVVLLYSVALRG